MARGGPAAAAPGQRACAVEQVPQQHPHRSGAALAEALFSAMLTRTAPICMESIALGCTHPPSSTAPNVFHTQVCASSWSTYQLHVSQPAPKTSDQGW